MAFDRSRGVMVMMGTDEGYGCGSGFNHNETWEYDGATWSSRGVEPFAYDGISRSNFILYDAIHEKIVRVRTYANICCWHYFTTYDYLPSTGSWVQHPASSPAYMNVKEPAVWFDETSGLVVVHGGYNYSLSTSSQSTVHLWDGRSNSWSIGSAGPALSGHSAAYDRRIGQAVIFGGTANALAWVPLNETWSASIGSMATYLTYGSGCPGSAGVPEMTVQSPPLQGTTFSLAIANLPPSPGIVAVVLGLSNEVGGLPMALDLGFIGLPGCTLRCALDSVFTLSTSGGSASYQAPIPVNPALQGVSFYNQVLSIDPAAGNPFGGAISGGGVGTIR